MVLDKDTADKKDLLALASAAIAGGVDIIQLRYKHGNIKDILKIGKALREITAKCNVLFIVNDDVTLANALDADGVHLGREDLSIQKGRAIIGEKKIIGYSTHTFAQAKKAVLGGADYISIGPIWETPTKAHYKAVGLKILKKLKEEVKIPIFAIGGINLSNIGEVIRNGADGIAVVRAIIDEKDPEASARRLKKELAKR
ncbi:MAG: thiamine phosphate synthase [Candidatus Omnitrophica bacterium]|nr:thiamine phosphate synthase [Candidatus Omnitrophota bacterium]